MTGPAIETPNTENAAAAAEPSFDRSRDGIDRLVEQSADQHYEGRALEDLAARDNITLADLRTLPGTEGMSDAALQAAWDKVNGPSAAATPSAAETAAAVKRAWKAYKGDAEVTDFSKLTAAEAHALQYEYTANGKPQRRTFDEIVRNAQQGHYNAERMQTLATERQAALDNWRKYEAQATTAMQQQQTWERALNAATRGDYTALQTILDAYQSALNGAGQPPAEGQQPQMIPAAEVEAERAGQQVYNTVVMPKAGELATRYGLPQDQVAEAIMLLVDREPPEFLNPARFQQIVDVELPGFIEQMQNERAPAAAAAPTADPAVTAELERLRAENATLKGSAAEQHNTHLAGVHAKRKAAPPAAATLPASGHGSETPDWNSAAGARDWLRNLKG